MWGLKTCRNKRICENKSFVPWVYQLSFWFVESLGSKKRFVFMLTDGVSLVWHLIFFPFLLTRTSCELHLANAISSQYSQTMSTCTMAKICLLEMVNPTFYEESLIKSMYTPLQFWFFWVYPLFTSGNPTNMPGHQSWKLDPRVPHILRPSRATNLFDPKVSSI